MTTENTIQQEQNGSYGHTSLFAPNNPVFDPHIDAISARLNKGEIDDKFCEVTACGCWLFYQDPDLKVCDHTYLFKVNNGSIYSYRGSLNAVRVAAGYDGCFAILQKSEIANLYRLQVFSIDWYSFCRVEFSIDVEIVDLKKGLFFADIEHEKLGLVRGDLVHQHPFIGRPTPFRILRKGKTSPNLGKWYYAKRPITVVETVGIMKILQEEENVQKKEQTMGSENTSPEKEEQLVQTQEANNLTPVYRSPLGLWTIFINDDYLRGVSLTSDETFSYAFKKDILTTQKRVQFFDDETFFVCYHDPKTRDGGVLVFQRIGDVWGYSCTLTTEDPCADFGFELDFNNAESLNVYALDAEAKTMVLKYTYTEIADREWMLSSKTFSDLDSIGAVKVDNNTPFVDKKMLTYVEKKLKHHQAKVGYYQNLKAAVLNQAKPENM